MTVLDEWQGRGVGLRLHACLHLQAQAAGIRQFLYDVSCENEGFIRHLQALGAQTVSRDRDLVRLMLPVLGGPRAVTAKTPSARALRAVLQDLTQPTPAAR